MEDGKREGHVICDEVSDGYHTLTELYDHRKALNAALFNYMYMVDVSIRGEILSINKPIVVKSKLHNDETMYDGYFIVMCVTPNGQISYHYELEYWDEFRIPMVDKIPWEYDGHTSVDVIERLLKL